MKNGKTSANSASDWPSERRSAVSIGDVGPSGQGADLYYGQRTFARPCGQGLSAAESLHRRTRPALVPCRYGSVQGGPARPIGSVRCVSPTPSGRLRVDEAAALAERAGVVSGRLGVADLATVLDQVDVRLVHLVGLEQRRGTGRARPPAVAFGGRRPTRCITRSTWRSIGSSGAPKQNSSSDRGGLLADPVDLGQPVAGLERRHLAEELEGVVAALLADPAQGRLEARRLLVGEAARPDDVGQLGEWRELDPFQSGGAPSRQPDPAPAGARVVAAAPAARTDTPARSASNATSAFMSALFWVRIVRISSLVGSRRRSQTGWP